MTLDNARITKICLIVKQGIENLKIATNQADKMLIIDNTIYYLRNSLGNRYDDFLKFAFPSYEVVPVILLMASEELPLKIKEFLEQ